MRRWDFNPALAFGIIASIVAAVFLVVTRPGYLTNVEYLGGVLLIEALAAAVWSYRQRFFPVVILVFILAGINVPMQGTWGAVRWLVLATGALAGMAVYFKNHSFSIQWVHWITFSCVIAAAISAQGSSFPKQVLLKALSLFLLFLYGVFGARLAAVHREEKFFAGLLWAVELLIYLSVAEYFIFHHQFFGNPNSLGAVMGIVAVPLMFWGVLASHSVTSKRRRTLALLLAITLLLASFARAGIMAACVSCALLCLLLRSYRTILKGAVIGLLIAVVVATVVTPENPAEGPASLTSKFVFKGKESVGILGSRRSVWDTTISSIEDHPWFGIGFGTARSRDNSNVDRVSDFGSNTDTTREHGDSYLALVEGVGLLGALPFFLLMLLVAANIGRVLIVLRRTGNLFAPGVPIAFVLLAGMVHAFFEDWLFAVGYYICVFFWALAFILLDFAPAGTGRLPAPGEINIAEQELLVPAGR
jgi:O-antigen ligase